MIWTFIALISAFSVSIADFLTKKYLSTTSVWVVYWVRIGYAVPFLLITGKLFPFPNLPAEFWMIMIPLVILETCAGILYARAIQISPLSLTIPFMAFTPVFLLGVGYIILGEVPSLMGTSGVVMVAAGAYLLNIHHTKYGILAPVKAVFKEKGSWMMLTVALLYSFSSSFGKKALSFTDPLFYSTFYMTLVAVIDLPVMFALTGYRPRLFFKKPAVYLMVGLAMAGMNLTHFIAVGHMNVAYMIAIKRMNLLFSILWGYWFFGEERIAQNILACIMMIGGVIIISFSR